MDESGRRSCSLSVTPSLPVETIPQLIAHAKANPGKLNFDTLIVARQGRAKHN